MAFIGDVFESPEFFKFPGHAARALSSCFFLAAFCRSNGPGG
jgi:hypothetical protein